MLQKYRNYKCFDPNKTILDSSHRKMSKPVTLSNFMFSKKATKIDEILHCTVHISTGAEQGDSNWKMGL